MFCNTRSICQPLRTFTGRTSPEALGDLALRYIPAATLRQNPPRAKAYLALVCGNLQDRKHPASFEYYAYTMTKH